MLVKAAYMYVGPHRGAFRVNTCTGNGYKRLLQSSVQLESHKHRVISTTKATLNSGRSGGLECGIGIVGKACHQKRPARGMRGMGRWWVV